MSCKNCHKRVGRYENKRWCEKCSKVHKGEPIHELPLDVFLDHTMIHMDLRDFSNLSTLSRRMREYMNHPDVWRTIYQTSIGSMYYPKIIKRLSSSTVATVAAVATVATVATNERVSILIENGTDIPFDIFHVRPDPGRPPKSHTKDLKPGDKFACRSFHGHRWLCVPTQAWLRQNQVSNVGCAFVVDSEKQGPGPDGSGPIFHRNRIKVPSIHHRIKDVDKAFPDYKEAFLRSTTDRTQLIQDKKKNQVRMDNQQVELKRLYRMISSKENEYKDAVRKDNHYKNMMHIVS